MEGEWPDPVVIGIAGVVDAGIAPALGVVIDRLVTQAAARNEVGMAPPTTVVVLDLSSVGREQIDRLGAAALNEAVDRLSDLGVGLIVAGTEAVGAHLGAIRFANVPTVRQGLELAEQRSSN